MDFVNRNLTILHILLGQTATTTPIFNGGTASYRTDPGNDPTFTAIMYVVFMVALIGGGTLFFRMRMGLIKRAVTRNESASQSSSGTDYGKS